MVEGFPDLSAGQGKDSIGILSTGACGWLAPPELEGTREHLEAMMAVVMPYAHAIVCPRPRPTRFGEGDELRLRSNPSNGWAPTGAAQ